MASLNDRAPANAAGRAFAQKYTLVTGGTATTELTLAGIRRGIDVIDSAIFYPKATEPIVADVTSEVSVPADGKVAFSTTNTTSGRVLVFWRKRVP